MSRGPSTIRVVAFVCLMAVILAGAYFVGSSGYGAQMNNYALDLYFRLRGRDVESSERIAIVAIDDETIARYGNLPLDRTLMAAAVRHVCQAGPRALGIDLLFSAPSRPEADEALAAALAACPQTVLSANLEKEQLATLEAGQWADPLPEFAGPQPRIGHAHADPDVDGVCRQILLAKAAKEVRRWALALETFRVYSGHQGPILEPDDKSLVVAENIIPVPVDGARGRDGAQHQRAMLINFAGPEGTFDRYSFRAVAEGEVAPEAFTNRAVLIGVTAQAAGDRKFTPVSDAGRDMPGVEIHANALRTMLAGAYLTRTRPTTEIAVLAGITALMAALLLTMRGLGLAVGLMVLGAAVHTIPFFAFRLQGVVAPSFTISLSFWLPLIGGGLFQYLFVWRRYLAADAASRRLRGGLEMVAHEIRTPLSAIQGSGEVISKYPLTDERRRQLGDVVTRESQRVATLVKRFLDVERLEAGEMELHREAVAMPAVINRVIERAEPLSRKRNVPVDAIGTENRLQANGDPELLEFALYNLVSNAIKYSPEGSPVAVRLRGNRALGMVFVEVCDQGAGIAPQDQERIFDRFFRTDQAAASGQPGLGLGLSIVREIARHHGGSVMLESTPGTGSKFTLALPMAAAAEA